MIALAQHRGWMAVGRDERVVAPQTIILPTALFALPEYGLFADTRGSARLVRLVGRLVGIVYPDQPYVRRMSFRCDNQQCARFESVPAYCPQPDVRATAGRRRCRRCAHPMVPDVPASEMAGTVHREPGRATAGVSAT